jgi:hypothetical protein
MERESDRQSNKVSKGKRALVFGETSCGKFLVTVKLARVLGRTEPRLSPSYYAISKMHEIR